MISCDKCAFCSKTQGGSLYCAWTGHFVPNIGCEDGQPITKIVTNADRIRSMSDEELAIEETAKGGCPHDCETPDDMDTDCVRCWLDWLKQEASHG